MRNLKKILALVLALVMSFSLMATANAFTDSDKINGTYEEAVEVLSGLKVFQGYDNGSFVPQGSITRAEVAAIIYRIVTGDVADKQVGIYADYNKFNDVKSTSWYAGYVNFCANAEYIKGYDAKTFGPNDPVTGYQALAMILRAVGYDKNGEFTGSDWQVQTAAVGKKLSITNNVSEGTLGTAATREVVAEILFRAIQVPQVTYTLAFGYNDSTLGVKNDSIGYETFKLIGAVDANDNWGRPSKEWKLDKAPYNKVLETSDTKLVSIAIDPIVSYTTAVTECQLAQDVGFTGVKNYVTYTNGLVNNGTDSISAVNTVATVGAQGRQTLVYSDRIVYIDTLLAQVTAVANARFDAAGHMITPATITLTVFDGAGSTATGAPTANYTMTNGSTNYTYAVGDMLLINAVQLTNGDVRTDATYKYAEIVGVAQSLVGAQTTIWNNISQHTVAGTTYNDNNRFHLDQAGNDITNHTWYFDQYGNLIGATDITSTNYAVLKSVRWVVGNPGYAEAVLVDLAGNESTATLHSIDGDAANNDNNGNFANWTADNYIPTYTVRGANVGFNAGNLANMSDEGSFNYMYQGYAMYRVDTRLDGSVDLTGIESGNVVVRYAEDAKFSGNASAIISSANAVLTYVSDNTQYLIRSGIAGNYTYTPVAGTAAMVSYDTADIFYVDVNNDMIADYVYIKDGIQTSARWSLVYVTTATYTGPLTEGSTVVYTMEALINGQAGTLRTADVNVVRELANNVGKVFYVTYDQFARATAAALVTSDNDLTNDTITKNFDPVNLGNANTSYAVYLSGRVTLSGNTLVSTNNGSFRVDNAVVYGKVATLAEADLVYDGIWVVYTPGVINTASAVYVGAKLGATATAWVHVNNNLVTFTQTTSPYSATVTGTGTAAVTAAGLNRATVTTVHNDTEFGTGKYAEFSVMSEDCAATSRYTVNLGGTHADYRLNTVTRIWDSSKAIVAAQGNTSYKDLADAIANIEDLNKGEAATLTVEMSANLEADYAIYTSTAAAEKGTVADFKDITGGLTAADLTTGNVLVLRVTKTGGGAFQLADYAVNGCTTEVAYVVYTIK